MYVCIYLFILCTGNLKEWAIILYGTSQNPQQHYSAQQSHTRMLVVPSPELILEEPEVQEEEEEEYTG